jgi:ABC-type uncharacterized transport system permease subunit
MKKTINQVGRVINQIFNPEVKISAIRYVFSFIGVMILGAVLIAAQGEDPVYAVKAIIKGAFGSVTALGNTIRWATPSLLTAAAALVAFKSGVVNLGIEGQMYVGALTAAIIGYSLDLPNGVHQVVCILLAGIAGILWVIPPALMRLFFNINEFITTMMLNFVATLLADFIVLWIIIPKTGKTTTTIKTPSILDSAKLPNLIKGTSSTYGFFIGLFVLLVIYVIFKYTIKGYELKQVGENLRFGKVGGVNIIKTFLSIFIISGFISGIVGGVEVTGGYNRYISKFSTTMGWEGIMITRIAAQNPIAIVVVSLVWGALKTGAMSMERVTSLNRLTVNILQMLFVLFIAIDYEGIYTSIKNRIMRKKEVQRLMQEQESTQQS